MAEISLSTAILIAMLMCFAASIGYVVRAIPGGRQQWLKKRACKRGPIRCAGSNPSHPEERMNDG
jgi:hypothetical protein